MNTLQRPTLTLNSQGSFADEAGQPGSRVTFPPGACRELQRGQAEWQVTKYHEPAACEAKYLGAGMKVRYEALQAAAKNFALVLNAQAQPQATRRVAYGTFADWSFFRLGKRWKERLPARGGGSHR